MKKRYLCIRHWRMVQRNREQAVRLWYGAFDNGVAAFHAADWLRAEAFLGTAYEIALLRFALDMQDSQHSLRAAQFAAVGRYYADVLCQLEDFEAAETCLNRVHDGLLHWSKKNHLPYSERVTALEELADLRQKLVALLRLMGKGAYARCTDLIAQQLARQAAASLYH